MFYWALMVSFLSAEQLQGLIYNSCSLNNKWAGKCRPKMIFHIERNHERCPCYSPTRHWFHNLQDPRVPQVLQVTQESSQGLSVQISCLTHAAKHKIESVQLCWVLQLQLFAFGETCNTVICILKSCKVLFSELMLHMFRLATPIFRCFLRPWDLHGFPCPRGTKQMLFLVASCP